VVAWLGLIRGLQNPSPWRLRLPVLQLGESAEDGVEGEIELLAEIFGEEAEDEDVVFLEERVFASVAAVGGGISEVLGAVDLDGELELRAIEVDLDFTPAVEGDGEFGVQLEKAGDEVLPGGVFSREMLSDDVISHRQEGAVRAVGALDPGLFANAANPFVATGRGVSRAAGFAALEAAWIDVFTASEE